METRGRSLLMQAIYDSQDKEVTLKKLTIDRWKRHVDQIIYEIKTSDINSWCAQYRVRLDQIFGIDFWKLSEPRPDLGSTCRSCDLLTASLMFGLSRRIAYCQDNYLNKYRRFPWKIARLALPAMSFYLVFMQPCKQDIKIIEKFSYIVS